MEEYRGAREKKKRRERQWVNSEEGEWSKERGKGRESVYLVYPKGGTKAGRKEREKEQEEAVVLLNVLQHDGWTGYFEL